MNVQIIMGRLGKDPESKTVNGTTIASFSLASDERRKVDGEWKAVPEWFNVTAFGKTAEAVMKFAGKGRRVLVVGKTQSREYEKDGQKRKFTEVVADRVDIIDFPDQPSDRGGQRGFEEEPPF